MSNQYAGTGGVLVGSPYLGNGYVPNGTRNTDGLMTPGSEFAVFVNRSGRWQHWLTAAESCCRQECAYLRDMLELDAKVFKREIA